MPEPTVAGVERQAKDHGYSITTSVSSKGVATVTLKDSYTNNVFSGDSGDQTGPNRYTVALFIAAQRMLDYENRSRPAEKKLALGEVTMY